MLLSPDKLHPQIQMTHKVFKGAPRQLNDFYCFKMLYLDLCKSHYYCPPLSRKRGDIKSHSSLCLSVCLSVTKTLTLAITFAQGSHSPWKVLEFWVFLEKSLKMNLSLKSPWIKGTFLEISSGSPWFLVLCILNWKFEWIQQIKRYKSKFSP